MCKQYKIVSWKKEAKVNLTTKFLNEKMLMFSKTSIPSFVYDPIDVLIFPDEDVKEIYENI